VLLLTTVALLNGCGGGASESGAVPATISCIVGPAATVLNWDPVGGATGYRIYSRTASGNFTMLQQVGNTTTLTVNGLVSGTTYYFVATAIDGSSNESSLSNVVCKSIS
jgi:fibronectin type 3 domain-containing protein